MIKRTKIVATLSVQRCTEELVRSLFKAGMNIVRINSAHASLENAAEIIRMVRSVSNSIPVMLDTKGPEIRVTRMDDAYPDGIRFAAGDRVKVRGTSVKTDIPSTREVIYMNVEHIVRDVPAGATMLIADGEKWNCMSNRNRPKNWSAASCATARCVRARASTSPTCRSTCLR